MSGAGAVLDAIARMRRAEREMARSRAGRPRPRRTNSAGIPDRLPYPCFFLCGDCGWLEEGATAHPHRRDGDQLAEPGPCPACQAKAWVDLRRQSTALAYREAEAMDGRMLDDTGRREGVWLGGLSGVTLATSLVLAEPGLAELPSLVLITFFGTWLATAVLVSTIRRRARPGRARPRRWRRPRPSHEVRLGPVEGTAVGEPVLHAPMSHTPCLGWAVQVRNEEGLLLDEQHHAELEIDGKRFAADSIALDLGLRELHVKPGDEAFGRFMRRRGLSPHDASLRVYVALLESGTAVALAPRSAAQGGLVLRSVACLAVASPTARAA